MSKLDAFLNHYISKNGSKSKSTSGTLISSVKRLERLLQMDFDEWTTGTFKNDNAILNILTEEYSINTIILTILSIIRFLEYKKGTDKEIKPYKEILNELIQERKKQEHKQEKTENEEKNWIEYTTLRDKVQEEAQNYLDKKQSFSKMRNFLILALFTLQPPTRIGNYLDMKIKTQSQLKRDLKSLNKKWNYISRKEDGKYRMIFNKYKTCKYLGKIDYTIENETLNKLLDKWINEYQKTDILFTNANGKLISQPNFTQAQQSISKKVVGVSLTTNMFRHIYFTWFLSTNPTLKQKEEVACIVGQTYKPSRMELYKRNETKKETEEKDI